MIYTNDKAIYDFKTHTPYPTFSYIQETTGESMEINAGDQYRARAIVKQITDNAKRELRKIRVLNEFNKIEYLIATNEAWQKEFLDLVCTIIYERYNELEENRQSVEEIVSGFKLLSIQKLQNIDYEYLEGY